MAKRGRKPVNLVELTMWEFEFFKAFHYLRDGREVPGPQWARPELARLTPQERDELSVEIQKTTLKEFVRLIADPKDRKFFEGLDRCMQELHFRQWKELALQELNALKPHLIRQRQTRREIWNALVRARTLPALKDVCRKWEQLETRSTLPRFVQMGAGAQWTEPRFPARDYILENAKQFFAMKRGSRFPKSAYADDSRIDYLARGMAGVLMNISPQTAIERLRNMKHAPGGPLWKKEPGGLEYCGCWRCGIARSRKFYEQLGYVDLSKRRAKDEKATRSV
jgi:hypothetical protein